MKILKVKFQNNLGWDTHVEGLKQKSRVIFAKLQRLVDKQGMRKILTTHFYGMLYYASQVWLTELTTCKQWKIVNSLHYKALRSAIGDYKNTIPKTQLNLLFERATPVQWMAYSNAKLAISLFNNKNGPPISSQLRASSYRNDRLHGRAVFMDSSRLKIGKNAFPNRLNCMKSIKFGWTDGIGDHALRQNLKKTFY